MPPSAAPGFPNGKLPYLLCPEEIASILNTDFDKGLSSEQVDVLSKEYGKNEIEVSGKTRWYTILSKQMFNAMVIVLVLAMALSFGIKDWVEGGVVTFIIVLNVTIGFIQESRAEKRMGALRELASPSARVIRDGKTITIPNSKVVPGDIVLLKTGDTVPADLRIFQVKNLACDEAQLTGESVPVDKDPNFEGSKEQGIDGIGDRLNMAYSTTIVRRGSGRGIVIATGMATEVGRIAAATANSGGHEKQSLDWRFNGKRQLFLNAARRSRDKTGKFLGLTDGTPLQRKLSILAYFLFGIAVLLALVVFAVNKFKMKQEVIIYATSLGIAIIPESLIAVLTITMVVAATVMRKSNVVVRDLSALEALGNVTAICSDKTGTLTEGTMIVRSAWVAPSDMYGVRRTSDPNNPTGGIVTHENIDEPWRSARESSETNPTAETPETQITMTPLLRSFATATALCNNATVRYDHPKQKWVTTGEPTEIALQVFAHRFDLGRETLESQGWTQVTEFPFDSSIKRMSVVYKPTGQSREENYVFGSASNFAFVKGASERIIDLCTHFIADPETLEKQPMSEGFKNATMDQIREFASRGQRVLAIAYRQLDFWEELSLEPFAKRRDIVESDLVFLGLVGIYDPPRRETKGAIADCCRAGIRVHMVTGDHPETARAIAQEVGIIPRDPGMLPHDVAEQMVMRASDFDAMDDETIDGLRELPLVLARCAPETKTRMMDALRRRGDFTAMTGDGVNDAPSLSRADIGIAMGSGSDVAKGAATMVLVDDRFNSIVQAIREGRRMFDNIQKFVLHLLTSNVGEVLLLIAGLGFIDKDGMSVFPVSPLQVIWINVATSSLPAFGLGREPAAREVMQRGPQDRHRGVFTNQIIVDMMVYGFLMGACTLSTFAIVVYGANDGNLGINCNQRFSDACMPVFRARAATFAELTWLILVSAWEFKSVRRSIFRLDPKQDPKTVTVFRDIFSNKLLFFSVIGGALTVIPLVYIPGLNKKFFKHAPISWEWALCVAFTIVFVAGMELWKMTKRHFCLFEDRPVQHGYWDQGKEDIPASRAARRNRSLTYFQRMSTGENCSGGLALPMYPLPVAPGAAVTQMGRSSDN